MNIYEVEYAEPEVAPARPAVLADSAAVPTDSLNVVGALEGKAYSGEDSLPWLLGLGGGGLLMAGGIWAWRKKASR